MKLNRTNPIAFLIPCLAFLTLGRALAAQPTLPTPPPVNKDEVLEMSPFSVNTSRGPNSIMFGVGA